jgi:hypothetical protein
MRSPTRCGLFLILLASAVFLSAQTYQGRILGTITDSSGAVVAGAKVTITNTATGLSRNLVSNNDGNYLAPDLDPGTYRVAVEAPGFKRAESTPVQLEVGRDVNVNLRLVPGAVNEITEVSAQDTLVDTTDSTLNGVLENKAINELPLEARFSKPAAASSRCAENSGRRISVDHLERQSSR